MKTFTFYTGGATSEVIEDAIVTPVDCVLSDWGEWIPISAWSPCANGKQSRIEKRIKTILVAPANGGLACGPTEESRTVEQACVDTSPTSGERLRIGPSMDFPSWYLASYLMKIPWEHAGGDWFDRGFMAQGMNDFATISIGSAVGDYATDVTDLINALIEHPEHHGSMIIRSTSGIARFASQESSFPPSLTITDSAGVTKTLMPLVDGTIDASAAGQSLAADMAIGGPRGVIRWDLNGLTRATKATLTLHLNYAYQPTFKAVINILRTPILNYDPVAAGGLVRRGIADTVEKDSDLRNHPSVLHYIPIDTYAAFQAAALATGPGTPYLGHPNPWGGVRNEFLTWPDGIPFARMYGGTSESIATAHFWESEPANPALKWQRHIDTPGRTKLHYRQLFEIGLDVLTGMDPNQGVKMPGLAGDYASGWGYADRRLATFGLPSNYLYYHGFEDRVDHGGPSFANPHVYSIFEYWYGADHPQGEYSGSGKNRYWRYQLKAGRRYCREQVITLNTGRPCTRDEAIAQGVDRANVGGTLAFFEPGGSIDRRLVWTPDFRDTTATTGTLWLNDGIIEEYLDGVLAYRDDKVPIRSHEWIGFELAPYFNWFHGGKSAPIGVCHWDTGGHVLSDEYVGPPKGA